MAHRPEPWRAGRERLHSVAGVGAREPLLLQSRHEHVKLLVQVLGDVCGWTSLVDNILHGKVSVGLQDNL